MWPGYRMLQGHVLCSSERQSVCAVVVDQLRDTREDTANLVQGEAQALPTLCLGHDDVHTALTGPKRTRQKGMVRRDGLATNTHINNYLYS